MKKIRAFTLVEMLAAMAVLSVLMVLFAQVVGWTAKSWSSGKQMADNLGKARSALDVISRDLQMGIFRSDAGAFTDATGAAVPTAGPAPSNYCFYTARSGGTTRAVSLVNYHLVKGSGTESITLERQILPMSWSGNQIGFGSTGIPQMANITTGKSTELAAGVLAFRMYFINQDTSGFRSVASVYSNSATKKTVAIGVALVAVDEIAQKQLVATGKLDDLITALTWEMPTDLDKGLGASWQSRLDNFLKGSSSASYPEGIRTGIRVFETVVPISSSDTI